MAKRKRKIDWEAIEREYRAGQVSVREIGRKHKIDHAYILRKAKEGEWERDLAVQVRKRVTSKLVTNSVTKSNASNEEIIEEAAEQGVAVVQSHRKDIRNTRSLVDMLTGQLEKSAAERKEIKEDIKTTDAKGPELTRMLRAVSLPTHSGVLRDLSVALKNLIPLERQAFNLDEPAKDGEIRLKVIYDESRTPEAD